MASKAANSVDNLKTILCQVNSVVLNIEYEGVSERINNYNFVWSDYYIYSRVLFWDCIAIKQQ